MSKMWWEGVRERKHTGAGVMYPDNKPGLGSVVEYIICTDCGFIIESYVKKPEKFKGTLYWK
ncbi:transcription initiation factor TFIIIB [Lysinibacillus sp. fls2-241-R2A-57]|uniref:transcription initiation factor TFIIIB n=1 Tax=Lysinibacillus sp. fls2-241-R2A-57 TaxID=3040292 RepID=UPI0033060B00